MRLNSLIYCVHNVLGFHGNRTDYYNPDNSYLNRVIELRRGLLRNEVLAVPWIGRIVDLLEQIAKCFPVSGGQANRNLQCVCSRQPINRLQVQFDHRLWYVTGQNLFSPQPQIANQQKRATESCRR